MKLQNIANSSARVNQLKTYQKMADNSHPVQLKANHIGLPDSLKAGIEHLSGHSMDDVKVHYNSAKPAQLQPNAKIVQKTKYTLTQDTDQLVWLDADKQRPDPYPPTEHRKAGDIWDNEQIDKPMHGGYTLARRPSFNRQDSYGRNFRVQGTAAMAELRTSNQEFHQTLFSAAVNQSKNLVKSSITLTYKNALNEVITDTKVIDKTWNSGETVYHNAWHTGKTVLENKKRGPSRLNIKDPLNAYVEKNKEKSIHKAAKYTASAHAHSENAMIIDIDNLKIFYEDIVKNAIVLLESNLSKGKILNMVLNIDSYPNSMCMGLCRSSLQEARRQLDDIVKENMTKKSVVFSSNYKTDMRAGSARVFIPGQNLPLKEAASQNDETEILNLKGDGMSLEIVPSGNTTEYHKPKPKALIDEARHKRQAEIKELSKEKRKKHQANRRGSSVSPVPASKKTLFSSNTKNNGPGSKS